MRSQRLIVSGLLSLTLACSESNDSDKSAEPMSAADSGSDSRGADGGAEPADLPDNVVALSDGLLEGERSGGTLRFLGVPFAAPPTGDLRLRPPQPVEPWKGMRDATTLSDGCTQNPSDFQPVGGMSEDCLYLNVWTPDTTPREPLPVMVWLHGGGGAVGAASEELSEVEGAAREDKLRYGGGRFIEAAPRPVVVVTVNYRLAALGFLAHPGLTAEQGTSGNYALLDQQAALRWVRDNIAAFGGDPENVTLFGQSAGGSFACLHMLMPDSAGLFQRVIMQSAGLCYGPRWTQSLEEEEAGGESFAEFLGCTGDDQEVLQCLRELDAEAFLDRPPADSSEVNTGGGLLWGTPQPFSFLPNVDGVVLPHPTDEIVSSSEYTHVPIIVGTNEREGAFFQHPLLAKEVADEDAYHAALERRLGRWTDEVIARYPAADYASPNDALAEVSGDAWFVCPARNFARALAAQGDTVFEYNYTHELGFTRLTILGLGPTHAAELPLLWNHSAIIDGATDADLTLGALMIDYWTRFAYTGDPNGDDAPRWPRFETDTEPEIVLADPASTVEGRKSDECDFWAAVEPRWHQ